MAERTLLERKTVGELRFFGHFLHYQMGGSNARQRIVVTIFLHGKILQKDLQEILSVQSGSLSEMIIKLEADGLVTKIRSEEDGRQLLLRLTPEGEAAARSCKASYDGQISRLMSCLTDQELTELDAILERLEAHWKETYEKG